MGRQLIYVIAAICAAMTIILFLILTAEPVTNAGGVPIRFLQACASAETDSRDSSISDR